MATGTINKSRTKKTSPLVDKDMKIHSDDPYFIKKAREAKVLIEKYGVPKAKQR